MNEHQLAVELRKSECKDGWSTSTLAMWIRDKGQCVYCNKDLLRNRSTAYHDQCKEHVLPKQLYPSLRDLPWNVVLACRECNSIKGRFDPNLEHTIPNEESIEEYKRVAKEYIKKERDRLDARYELEQRGVRAAIAKLYNLTITEVNKEY